VALDAPDFRTISDFRKRHLKALAALFVRVLQLAEAAGLVKLGWHQDQGQCLQAQGHEPTGA
jgi:hypothetical protein